MTDEELYEGAAHLRDAAKAIGRDLSIMAYAMLAEAHRENAALMSRIRYLETQIGRGYGRLDPSRSDAGTTDEWIATGRDYSED